MKTSDFDYRLPPERIAQTPVEPRDTSRLMVLDRQGQSISHHTFRDIGQHLLPGDVLVCNESRVIPARIFGRRIPTGGRVELLLVARRDERTWEALVKPGRRLHEGAEIELLPEIELSSALASSPESPSEGMSLLSAKSVVHTHDRVRARVVGRTESGGRLVEFEDHPRLDAVLETLGIVPLPPYVHTRLDNPERYQTVYARVKGSVAAPTAGLHFTPGLIGELQAMGAQFQFVTLHIGLDTFRPVQVEDVGQHKMHSEFCELGAEVAENLNRARAEGRRIVAVGTTAVRVLESAAQAAEASNGSTSRFTFKPFAGWTDIFIYPGCRFRGTDAMITNFHLPRSTLLMLVSAFAGTELIRAAYAEAIEKEYRFYSFGDALFVQ